MQRQASISVFTSYDATLAPRWHLKLREPLVMPLERAGGQAQFIVHEPPADDHTSIGQLLTWIEQNPSADLSLPVIARRAAMSIRTLSRHFRAQVGTTPANWIARARVRRAQALLETTQLQSSEWPQNPGLDQQP